MLYGRSTVAYTRVTKRKIFILITLRTVQFRLLTLAKVIEHFWNSQLPRFHVPFLS